jgi:hypothetical protein
MPVPVPPGGKEAAARRPPLPDSMPSGGGSLPTSHGLFDAVPQNARPSVPSVRQRWLDAAAKREGSPRTSMDSTRATRASIDDRQAVAQAALFAALVE